jgi:GNAT superfamily N-acetyltransferase
MSVAIRRAFAADAPLLAEHRARVWTEVGGWREDELAPVLPAWTSFIREGIAAGEVAGWIAEETGTVLGSGSLLVHHVLARPNHDGNREGRIHGVFVAPAARRRGIARAIVQEIIAYARECGFIRLTLHPSDEARSLYASLGFVALDEMGLRLTEE